VRFMIVIQLTLCIIAVTAAWCCIGLVRRSEPLAWNSWRVPSGSLMEDGSQMFTWNWRLLASVIIACGWSTASLFLTAFFIFGLIDFVKSANYILLAEGGGLKAEAPKQRMRLNPLQLLLYIDIDSVLKYLFERVIFAPVTVSWPCAQSDAGQSACQRRGRQLAKERRREWRMMREAAIQAAMEDATLTGASSSTRPTVADPTTMQR
jgi:hypothetical protein